MRRRCGAGGLAQRQAELLVLAASQAARASGFQLLQRQGLDLGSGGFAEGTAETGEEAEGY